MRYIASVSFGKDSLAMLLNLIEKKYQLDEVIFYDTGMEFKAIYDIRDKVRILLKDLDIKYTELKPEIPFIDKMLNIEVHKRDGSIQFGYGLCGGRCRWGTTEKNKIIERYLKENYGQDNVYYKSALKGVFAHHRGISNGIRIAIEYAMKRNLIKCIVCTSTLAQGVNLPIRYLIISGIYQSQERIKVRDFHNLIGRAGRAGLYTEGTILLSLQ